MTYLLKKSSILACLSLLLLNSPYLSTVYAQSTNWQAVVAFPNLTFDNALLMIPEPRTNRLYVCGEDGIIWFFTNDPNTATKTVFLDIRSRTQAGGTAGLLAMAFHPEYGLAGSTNRGYFYVWYSYSGNPVGGNPPLNTPSFDRLSRFTVPNGSLVADPNSELVLVNQYDPDLYDDGGMLFFGSDGFLYFANGDVGGANDSYGAAQNISGGLFGGVFRIDVNQDPTKSHPIRRQPISSYANNPPPSYSANYYIPNDNPFLDPGGSVLEEFYALGFRNPWRGCFDPPTGRIWYTDLGEDASEEVDIVVKGGNYQWAYMEGCVTGPKPRPSQIIGTESPPIYCYPHTQGNEAVIGGFVYRGSQYASQLGGQYIFGDYISERIWAMSYNGDGPPTVTQLCTLPPTVAYANLSSFGLDDKGEIYICRVGLGQNLWRLVLTNSASGGPLPAPWANQDIGTVGLNGSASYSNGVFVVSGSGFDIWDPRDAFQMVYQPWTGDGQITAQVTSLGDTSPYAKAGVMFRNTLTSGSQHALMIVMAEEGTGFQRRDYPDSNTTFTASVPAGVPYWVLLNRTGNLFSAYGSTNGINWILAGTETISFTSNSVYVGLAVTSHNDTNLTTATFNNVTVSGPAPKLSISRYDKAGRMLLQFPGNLGRQYTIQVSANLTSWSNLVTITNSSLMVSYIDGATNQAVRFYRTVLAN